MAAMVAAIRPPPIGVETSPSGGKDEPPSPTRSVRAHPPRSPSPAAETVAGWGHWMSDGLFGSGDASSPRTRSKASAVCSRVVTTGGSRSPSPEPLFSRSLSSPLLDAADAVADGKRTSEIPDLQSSKVWSARSMPQMADFGTVPAGLPSGITDNEKKLWLALYCRARQLLASEAKPMDSESERSYRLRAVREAVDAALDEVTEKHSLEYRFGVRWAHSVKTCLAMRQQYRSSDVYS